jgi:hypothetical protein
LVVGIVVVVHLIGRWRLAFILHLRRFSIGRVYSIVIRLAFAFAFKFLRYGVGSPTIFSGRVWRFPLLRRAVVVLLARG